MFLGIDWKVRFSNPTFIVQLILAIFLPILAYFGLNWEDMTTWSKIGYLLLDAIQNPVVVVSVILSIYNAIIDPTTKGFTDQKKVKKG